MSFGLQRLLPPGSEKLRSRFILNDKRVLNVFRKNGKYHSGIQLVLNDVELLPKNGKTSIKYTYTVTNEDSDDYYVYDPAKMGNDLFQHFTNGPILYDSSRKGVEGFIWPKSSKVVKVPDTTDKAQMGWLTLLKSGESMTRTLTKDGYPDIGPGKYEWTFLFASPGKKLTEKQRQKKDVRILIKS
jgi:hypothetical protein